MYYMGFSWESFGIGPLPTSYRRWFLERINTEIAKSQEQGANDIPTKAAHHNMPDVRAMIGKTRQNMQNPRLQRPNSNF